MTCRCGRVFGFLWWIFAGFRDVLRHAAQGGEDRGLSPVFPAYAGAGRFYLAILLWALVGRLFPM
jgi:hypothetical protein